MRRWPVLLLALVPLAAWWLMRAESGGSAAAPAAEVPGVPEPDATLELIEVSSEGEPERREPTSESLVENVRSATPDEHATQLDALVLLPGGAPWAGGRLLILGEEGIWVPRSRPSEHEPSASNFFVLGEAIDPRTHVLALELDADGVARLKGLPAGQPFELRAVDALGGVGSALTCDPLAPGESREVVIRLERAPLQLFGRCVDEFGEPLAGVTVTAWASSLGTGNTSDVSGSFTTVPLFRQAVTVSANLDGYLASAVTDVQDDRTPIELVLRKGWRLAVEFVDELGAPVLDVTASLHTETDGTPIDVRTTFVGGARVYELLPQNTLTLRWGGACRPQELTVEAGTQHLRLRAIRPGQLAIQMSELPGGLEAVYSVELTCAESGSPASAPKGVLNTGRQQMLWSLSPDRYRLQIRAWPATTPGESMPWGAPIDVEVRSGETTLERLGG